MSERRMSQVMPQGYGLGQVAVEFQGHRNGPGDLRYFKHMGQPGPIVVSGRRQENLGFVFQAAESFGMNNPVPVPLKSDPYITLRFRPQPSFAFLAETGVRRKDLRLVLLHLFSDCSTHIQWWQ